MKLPLVKIIKFSRARLLLAEVQAVCSLELMNCVKCSFYVYKIFLVQLNTFFRILEGVVPLYSL